jgi:crotonobetainyl-CoA:carnitine CoA-transferase CaiB-like acyl-CoA transferase
MNRGKRTTRLNLMQANERERLTELAAHTDVFLQGYRPDGLHDKGFGLEHLVTLRPGIVYASVAAYGFEGPWSKRRGVRILIPPNMHDPLLISEVPTT